MCVKGCMCDGVCVRVCKDVCEREGVCKVCVCEAGCVCERCMRDGVCMCVFVGMFVRGALKNLD